MATKKPPPLDLSRVRTYPLEKRASKVQSTLISARHEKGGTVSSFLKGLPDILAAKTLTAVANRIAEIHQASGTVHTSSKWASAP